MAEPPTIEILSGSPTPSEADAVKAAVLRLWREQVAAATAASSPDPWTAAARAASVGTGSEGSWGRDAQAWRRSGRLVAPRQSNLEPGRGDAR